MRTTPNAITELPPSPDEERRSRMVRYTIAMSIRVVCLVIAVLVPGWWALVPMVGAVVLPYIAVVIANNAGRGPRASVRRPGALLRTRRDEGAA